MGYFVIFILYIVMFPGRYIRFCKRWKRNRTNAVFWTRMQFKTLYACLTVYVSKTTCCKRWTQANINRFFLLHTLKGTIRYATLSFITLWLMKIVYTKRSHINSKHWNLFIIVPQQNVGFILDSDMEGKSEESYEFTNVVHK